MKAETGWLLLIIFCIALVIFIGLGWAEKLPWPR